MAKDKSKQVTIWEAYIMELEIQRLFEIGNFILSDPMVISRAIIKDYEMK